MVSAESLYLSSHGSTPCRRIKEIKMSRSVKLIAVTTFLRTGLSMLKELKGVLKEARKLEDILRQLEELQSKDIEERDGVNEFERF